MRAGMRACQTQPHGTNQAVAWRESARTPLVPPSLALLIPPRPLPHYGPSPHRQGLGQQGWQCASGRCVGGCAQVPAGPAELFAALARGPAAVLLLHRAPRRGPPEAVARAHRHNLPAPRAASRDPHGSSLPPRHARGGRPPHERGPSTPEPQAHHALPVRDSVWRRDSSSLRCGT
jgi:hypothetical protein